MIRMEKETKIKIWMICLALVILGVLARNIKILNNSVTRIIFWIAVVGLLYPTFRHAKKSLAWTINAAHNFLSKGIGKKLARLFAIRQLFSKKKNLIAENRDLFENEIIYEGKVSKKLVELEAVFFLNKRTKPYKRIETLNGNLIKMYKLNQNLYDLIADFAGFTREEQEILLNTIGFSSEIGTGKGIENLKKLYHKHSSLNGEEINKKLKFADEEEIAALKGIYAKNKEVLANAVEFEKEFEKEKAALEGYQQLAKEILDAEKDEKIRVKIKTNLIELEKMALGAVSLFETQSAALNKIFIMIINEKNIIEKEIEKEMKKTKEQLISEQKLILLTKTAAIGDELIINLPNGTNLTISDVSELIELLIERKLSEKVFEELMQKTGGKSLLSEFLYRIGGDRLVAVINSKVTKTGENGLEQLEKTLLEFFNLDQDMLLKKV